MTLMAGEIKYSDEKQNNQNGQRRKFHYVKLVTDKSLHSDAKDTEDNVRLA